MKALAKILFPLLAAAFVTLGLPACGEKSEHLERAEKRAAERAEENKAAHEKREQ
jgi:hypothetical protein